MKKKLCIFFLFFVCLVPSYGQQLEFNVSFDTVRIVKAKPFINAVVEIKGGTPDFKVYCLDGFPGLNSKVIANGIQVSERKFQITNIMLSVFHLCVFDRDGKMVSQRYGGLVKK